MGSLYFVTYSGVNVLFLFFIILLKEEPFNDLPVYRTAPATPGLLAITDGHTKILMPITNISNIKIYQPKPAKIVTLVKLLKVGKT